MGSIKSFRDLEAWQLSMDLVDHIYLLTKTWPRDDHDLRRQMRRAAVSIPANVAEGHRRMNRRGAYQNHVSIAMGSQGELETELEVAFRNGLLARDRCSSTLALLGSVRRLLRALHDSLD